MLTKLPSIPGIYAIDCLPTGKLYIGSAVNLRRRWQEHSSALRLGKHCNIHLQHAWNKYSDDCFEVYVLELVAREELFSAEQHWIDRTCCTDRRLGFNLSSVAGGPGDLHAHVWEGFIDPDGNTVTIKNLHDFCRQHDLDFPSMLRLSQGKSKLKSHKGWAHVNSPRKRDYIKVWKGFINPDGIEVTPITNLKAFCREHGLDATHMVAVANGRICSHRKWTHRDGRARQDMRTYLGFINPSGEHVTIINLAVYCRESNLHPVKMHHLKSGKIKQYKGWTWNNEGSRHAPE